MSFAGKVVLVTGSTTWNRRGVRAAVRRVGRCRHGVAAAMPQRGGRSSTEISAAGGTAQFVRRRSARRGACERLIDETVERLGGLDVLVNNAGILYTANALDTTDEQWLDTMAVNVNALFYLSRAAVRHMKATGRGVIVNVASEWGLNGERNHVAYCASKGAVVQITRCMALDHARDNIRVNSRVSRRDPHAHGRRDPGQAAAATARRICASSPQESPCAAWRSPSKSRVACISWRRTTRAMSPAPI